MAPPLSSFVDINVQLTGASAEVFSFGVPLGIFEHSATANRVDGPYTSLEEAVDAGFTSGDEPEANAWVQSMFSQGEYNVDQVYIGRADAADATWTATMTAVNAAIGVENYYLLNIESRTEADILLVAAVAEAAAEDAPKLFLAQTEDAATLAGTAGNVMLDLQALDYDRTATFYHRFSVSTDGAVVTDGYGDAAWASRCGSFRLDSPNGVGSWKYKTLAGITYDPLTSAQANAIWNANGNIYGRTKGLSFTSNGKVASGKSIDVITSLDWLRLRLGEAVLGEFVGEPNKIAFTNSGINRIASVVHRVLGQGVDFGHLSGDHPRTVAAPKVSQVSSGDKTARLLEMPGNVVLAGAVEKFAFNLRVQE